MLGVLHPFTGNEPFSPPSFQFLAMSTSRGSVKSEGEFLLDEDGWKSEAEAIIRDVGEFVKVIHVSDALEVRKRTSNLLIIISVHAKVKVLKVIPLQSSASRIYLNVTTIESKDFTVALTGEGFRVVAEGKHDSVDEENHLSASTSESTVFETPYSLLGSISPGFRFVNVKEQPGEILDLNTK